MKSKIIIAVVMLLIAVPRNSKSNFINFSSNDKYCIVTVKIDEYRTVENSSGFPTREHIRKIYVSDVFLVYNYGTLSGPTKGQICEDFMKSLNIDYSGTCDEVSIYDDYNNAVRDLGVMKQSNEGFEIINTRWSWRK